MPDRRRSRARLTLAAALLAASAAAAPAVLAQSGASDPAAWDGSTFTAPFSGRSGTVTDSTFEIAGVIRKQASSFERIIGVDVRFEHADGRVPSSDDPCVPASPGAATQLGSGDDDDDGVATHEFSVPETTWPCNGRYRIVAEARSNQELGTFELVGELAVAVPPPPVTVVGARWDGTVDAVEVVWSPLEGDDLPADTVGYRIERSGPGDASFAPIGPDRRIEEETVVLDRPDEAGDYRYRVRAIRSGPGGPVFSPERGSRTAEVTVPGSPPTSTTTSPPTDGPRRPGVNRGAGVATGRVTPRLPSPPTTVDTGFEQTLDYGAGDAPVVRPGDEQALAGEGGQSIIRTDDEGVGLLAPAAGALVLLGWAGHVAYLNRLAKQF